MRHADVAVASIVRVIADGLNDGLWQARLIGDFHLRFMLHSSQVHPSLCWQSHAAGECLGLTRPPTTSTSYEALDYTYFPLCLLTSWATGRIPHPAPHLTRMCLSELRPSQCRATRNQRGLPRRRRSLTLLPWLAPVRDRRIPQCSHPNSTAAPQHCLPTAPRLGRMTFDISGGLSE